MESKRVSLLLIHEHLMVPWNYLGKGDCCGRFESITDGYYCEVCDLFFHKKCGDEEAPQSIQHPSHSDHTLQLQSNKPIISDVCGKKNVMSYRCEICDFDVDLFCAKYPPQSIIEGSETHCHKLTLMKKLLDFDCGAKCGNKGYGFHYKCEECGLAFHMSCAWHPPEIKHPLEYTTVDAGERVSLPWIHKHFMMPWVDTRRGDCCGRCESIPDGYYCKRCDFFVHKKCGDEAPESIQHPSHSIHPLWLRSAPNNNTCSICGKMIVDVFYRCEICDFYIDLHCATYPPPEVIQVSEMHHHKLALLKDLITFDCHAKCGKIGYGFLYKCHECDIAFHVDCVWHPPEVKHSLEVNHSYHSLHPLKLFMGRLPDYYEGKCRLCGRYVDQMLFYHCSSCYFTLDMRCVLHPPPRSLLDLKAHCHQLTLLPRLISFTCNVCGLSGDGSPYICVPCDFVIHQDCLDLPRIIKINRHDHRVSHIPLIGVVNSVCGVCREKVNWTCGGYSCQRCPGYVVHSKCATRMDVWNGKELEGLPEETEDTKSYVAIDENTIQYFSHKEHYLRLHVNGVLYEENKRCSACNHPVGLKSFYGCIACDFVLHQPCAEFPRKKWHVLHNEQLTLVTSNANCFHCYACGELSNGFMYKHGNMEFDVQCGSIYEPFFHPSHHHPLYYIPRNKREICNGCNLEEQHVLRCIEDGCEFVLGFKCATVPQVVKHRVDNHPLSLYYGDKEASGKYWCDICEQETNPKTWFYT